MPMLPEVFKEQSNVHEGNGALGCLFFSGSFPSFGAACKQQQQQQQHLAPVLSLELLGTGATAASGSSHPPPHGGDASHALH